MKSKFGVLVVLLLLSWSQLLLLSCQLPSYTNSSVTEETQYLTVSRLSGTWVGESNFSTGQVVAIYPVPDDPSSFIIFQGPGSTVETARITFDSDGSYRCQVAAVSKFDNGNEASTSYTDQRGSFTVESTSLSVTIREQRTSESQFNDPTSGWQVLDQPILRTWPAILHQGKLYGGTDTSMLMKSTNTQNEIYGNWSNNWFDSSVSQVFTKQILTFDRENSFTSSVFCSETNSFSNIPIRSKNGTYALSVDRKLTFTVDGVSYSKYVMIFDGYLSLGKNPSDRSAGAFIKQ